MFVSTSLRAKNVFKKRLYCKIEFHNIISYQIADHIPDQTQIISYQMAGMNQQLDHEIETVFLMADVSLQPIASKLVKEIAIYGGDIAKFVSPKICDDVAARVEEIGRKGDY